MPRYEDQDVTSVKRPAARPVPRGWFTSIWLGIGLLSWGRILFANRRELHRARVGFLLAATVAAVLNSMLGVIQKVVFYWPLRSLRLVDDPIFVVGHWRSGTTVLHYLLSLDPRYTAPTNYVCFAPHHFLLTEWLFKDGFTCLAPATRPMDDIPLDPDLPQEDEFALLFRGATSPYASLAFPSRGLGLARHMVEIESSPAVRERRIRTLRRFLKELTWRARKRVVLKSPTHSYSVAELARVFPNAQFVFLTREPEATLASTVAMWTALCESQSVGSRPDPQLVEHVLENWQTLSAAVEDAKGGFDSGRFCEVQYECLLKDPVGTLKDLYAGLGWGEFDSSRPEMVRALLAVRMHTPARYVVPEVIRGLEGEG